MTGVQKICRLGSALTLTPPKTAIEETIMIIIIIIIRCIGFSVKEAGRPLGATRNDRTRTMQKSALLGSAHILRKVLEV